MFSKVRGWVLGHSVDSITRVFHTQVRMLKEIEDELKENVNSYEEEAKQYQVKANNAKVEADRAATIRSKIENIIGGK